MQYKIDNIIAFSGLSRKKKHEQTKTAKNEEQTLIYSNLCIIKNLFAIELAV